jgi:hypothetical protein
VSRHCDLQNYVGKSVRFSDEDNNLFPTISVNWQNKVITHGIPLPATFDGL